MFYCFLKPTAALQTNTSIFSLIHSMPLLSLDRLCWHTSKLVSFYLKWVQSEASSSRASSSVWWWVLAGPQASRPVQTHENADWVGCHLRISWSQLHIFQTFPFPFDYSYTWPSCFHSTHTSYKFRAWRSFTADLTVGFLYTLQKCFPTYFCAYFYSEVIQEKYTDRWGVD